MMTTFDPYITTENFEKSGAHRGRVQILDSYRRNDSHLTFVDLKVANIDGDVIELHRVDLGKLVWLVRNAEDNTEIITPEESMDRHVDF